MVAQKMLALLKVNILAVQHLRRQRVRTSAEGGKINGYFLRTSFMDVITQLNIETGEASKHNLICLEIYVTDCSRRPYYSSWLHKVNILSVQ